MEKLDFFGDTVPVWELILVVLPEIPQIVFGINARSSDAVVVLLLY